MKKRAKGGTKYSVNIARFMRQHPDEEEDIEYLGDHAAPYVRQKFTFEDDTELDDQDRALLARLGPDLEEVQPRPRKSAAERKASRKKGCIEWLAKQGMKVIGRDARGRDKVIVPDGWELVEGKDGFQFRKKKKGQKDKDEKKGKAVFAKPKEKKQPGKKPPKQAEGPRDVLDKKHVNQANAKADERKKRADAESKKRAEKASDKNLLYSDFAKNGGSDMDDFDGSTPEKFIVDDFEEGSRERQEFVDARSEYLRDDDAPDHYLTFIIEHVVPYFRRGEVPPNNPTRGGLAIAIAWQFAYDNRKKDSVVLVKLFKDWEFNFDNAMRPASVTLAQVLFNRIMKAAFEFLRKDIEEETKLLTGATDDFLLQHIDDLKKENDAGNKISSVLYHLYGRELQKRGIHINQNRQEPARPPRRGYDEDGKIVDLFQAPAEQPGLGLEPDVHHGADVFNDNDIHDVHVEEEEDEGDETEDEEPLVPIRNSLDDEKPAQPDAPPFGKNWPPRGPPPSHFTMPDLPSDVKLPWVPYKKFNKFGEPLDKHGRIIDPDPITGLYPNGEPANQDHAAFLLKQLKSGRVVKPREPGGSSTGRRTHGAGAFTLPTEEDYSPEAQAGVMAGQTMMLPVESDYEMKAGAKPAVTKSQKSNEARAANPWVRHVQEWANTHGIKYGEALKDPEMRSAYYSGRQPAAKRRKLSGGSVSAAQWEGGCACDE